MKRSVIIIICIFFLSSSLLAQEVEYVGSTLWGWPLEVKVVGQYAFCIFPNGLMVLDISDPTDPVYISKYFLDGWNNDICIAEDYAYISNGVNGFNIIDISDPTRLLHIVNFGDINSSNSLQALGDYAFLVGGEGFHIINISDPNDPFYVSGIDSVGLAFALGVSGNFAYIGTFYDGIVIIDISDETNPYIVNHVNDPYYIRDLSIIDNNLYFLDSGGLNIMDITFPGNPVPVGEFNATHGLRFLVSGNNAFISINNQSFYGEVQIVDLSDPFSPEYVSSYYNVDYPTRIDVLGNNLYIADSETGILILDIGDLSAPFLIGDYSTVRHVYDLHIRGSTAYTIGLSAGLNIADISDPLNPTPLSGVALPIFTRDVFISGDYAYIANYNSGLQIVDVSDPLNPNVVAVDSSLEHVWGVSVSGNYAYLIGWGFAVLDVTDPINPTIVYLDTDLSGLEIIINNPYAYLLTAGLYILNITDPANPDSIGFFEAPNNIQYGGLAVDGDYAYIVHRRQLPGNSGMYIIDISERSSPILTAEYEMYYAEGIFCNGSYAYIADKSLGLVIVDVSDHSTPNPVCSYWIPADARSVCVLDDLIYLANGYALMILRFDPQTGIIKEISELPIQFSLSQNHPNPFNATTTIRYDLPTDSDMMLEIYDILGRKIETLVEGWQPAGAHSIIWDAQGVSSGVYFYKIQAGEYVESRSCLLLK